MAGGWWGELAEWKESDVELCLVGVLARNFAQGMTRDEKYSFLSEEFVRGDTMECHWQER